MHGAVISRYKPAVLSAALQMRQSWECVKLQECIDGSVTVSALEDKDVCLPDSTCNLLIDETWFLALMHARVQSTGGWMIG